MLVQIVAPTYDLLASTKEYLRILDDDSDNLIASFIDTAYIFAEDYTNRSLKTATYELTLPTIADGFTLPKNPIQSISKIELRDINGDYSIYDDTHYYLYEEYGIGCIKFDNLPSLVTHKQAIKITFIAGYTDIPEALKNWIKYKASILLDGETYNENKFVDSILDQYRVRSY